MIDEQLLDDPDALAAADSGDSLLGLASAGAQVRAALGSPGALERLAEDGRPRTVLVAGLGGSAVVGEVVAALAGPGSAVPVLLRRGGPLPGWVGPLDLVVAVSLSGRAPEPLTIAAEAARRGARLLSVSLEGSPLADVTARGRGTVLPVQDPRAPGRARLGTRTGLWSLLTPILLACSAVDVIRLEPGELDAAADRLDAEAEACRPSSESFVNPAKVLAVELDGTVPVVLGEGEAAAAAAARVSSMLARTARVPAVRGTLPDDAGDVVSLFDGPLATSVEDVFADPFTDSAWGARLRLLLLADDGEQRRAGPLRSVADAAGVRTSEVVADPGRPLERLAQLVARTDFAATYLALGCGVDPARSPHLADLRELWAGQDRPR